MILKRIAINRLPGIGQPFAIEAAGRGIQVIFGPNGIGKSSICRAVEGLYWEDRGSSRQTSVSGEFEWDGEVWRAEREGSTIRWSRGGEGNAVPNLPPSHTYRCFFLQLKDLVDPSRAGTVEIAAEIRRQMSGGFDLHDIRSSLFSPVSQHRKRRERNSYNTASKDVETAEAEQVGLQRRVDQLDQLKSQLEEAETAAGRLGHVERAIGLASRRDELAGIKRQLDGLPESLAKLTGKERVEVEQHRTRLTELEKRARVLATELNDARAAQQESGLAAPLDEADLAIWRDNADGLGRIELALEAAGTELEGARNKLVAALDAVGGNLIDNAALTLPNHAELFELLRDGHSHESRIAAIEERLRLLDRVDPSGTDHQDTDKLRNAIEALRSWLRAPQPRSFAVRIRSRWPWLLAAIAMLLAGTGLAGFVAGSLALLAVFGAGIALAALLVGDGGGLDGRRLVARAAFEEMGLEDPATWEVPAVQSRLRSLESGASELEASVVRARDRDVERKSLEAELDGLRKREPPLDARRKELRAILGLEELPSDADLVDFARALDQLRLACGEYEAVTGKVQHLEFSQDDQLTKVAEILEHHGEPRPAGAAAVKARLNNLANRNSRLEQALADERRTKAQLEENAADCETALGAINRIYADAGLDDGDVYGLTLLLETLPQYHQLTKQKSDLESKIELDCAELEKARESELLERDGRSLDKLKAELEDAASQAIQLRGDIATVTAQMNQARRGNVVQDRIANREEARAKLRDLRDQALFVTAGEFLIEEVEQVYEETRMPRVFERARDHFSAFTFHNYELRLEKGAGTPRLFADELRAGQRRELDELSDGTRVQLLLAARIAFAEEVEQGKVLPLFLDEALDQSDPQRFEAIVRSLGRVARDQGRQIFYLTSDPLDVDRIRHALSQEDCELAAPIDLGLIRTGAASIGGPQALRVGPRPAVPAPDGLSPEDYGAALGVPAFRPARGFAQQHVFYVLWDDLALLHAFLTNGIERAGQWKTISGTPLAERLGSRSIAASEVGLRLDLLEVFCELWKQGRGLPVDFDALKDSGALSQRYLDDVVAIARELHGDAEKLLAVLGERADPRLKGFRTSSLEGLQSYLTEREYLDERPIFSENELRLHALSSPAANKLAGSVASDYLHRWWQWAGKSVSA